MNLYTVEYLKKNFNSLTYEEKILVKNAGRPKPEIDLSQITKCKSRDYARKFRQDMYEKNDWICGCSVTNRLLCFPCILFHQGGAEPSWSKTGVKDLGHLSQKMKKHENSKAHINAQLELKLLGKVNIQQQLDSAYRRNIQQQNEQVRKNRYVLSKIIDCIKFCGAFELARQFDDDRKDSSNPEIFKGLINFSSELDISLKDHFENSVVFKGTSKIIQNELLDCMLSVAQDRIKKEVLQAEYVAVICDETTDVSNQYQMTVVFRYILPDGTPVERFWCFTNPSDHNAISLSECIRTILKQVIDKPEKLISQSYDVASVMRGCHSSVQALIQNEYKYAMYVHCYAHQLNSILSPATSQNQEVRVFFSNLSDIANFFSHSPQRVATLNEIVGQRIPHTSATQWNFKNKTVSTVYEHRELLIECMEKIEETSRHTATINQATAICRMLQDAEFVFWLSVFHRILPHADTFYNQLEETVTDPVQIQAAISCFETAINKERYDIDTIECEIFENYSFQTKRRRVKDENSYNTKTIAAMEVCDNIITHVKERFSFTKHLNASTLFVADRFPQMDKKFPIEHLEATIKAYPFLDKVRLQTELEVIYRRRDFRKISGAIHLLKFITDNNLQGIFSATLALLQILVTIPMITPEAERSFSTLQRIKTFLRSSMNQENLTALAMLSIEKQFIQDLPDFNEAVMNKFAEKKHRRNDFYFKQCDTV